MTQKAGRLAILAVLLFSARIATADPATPPRGTPAVADSILAQLERGRYAVADSLARRAVPIARKQYGATSIEYVITLDAAVRALMKTRGGLEPRTLKWAEDAVAIKQRNAQTTSKEMAKSLQGLALVQEARGDYSASTRTAAQAVATLERGGEADTLTVASALNDLGSLLVRACEYD